MNTKKFVQELKNLYNRLNGSTLEYDISGYGERLNEIKKRAAKLKHETDQRLKDISGEYIAEARNGRPLDDLIIDAYALVHETIQRILELTAFDCQIVGAMVMHQGKIVEMQTGEGKTLAAVFPTYLNALSGKGIHVLTFNDYLARRDAVWMGAVYEFLGLSVCHVQEGMRVQKRREAYASDITYLTAKEAGFDFLRDSLAYDKNDRLHRNFHFALIDEADSILIDEARIPLVLAAADDSTIQDTFRLAEIARRLEKGIDFEFDEYSRNFFLAESGEARVERGLNCGNLYDPENLPLLTKLNCAIHAEYLVKRDVDYIVRQDKIELVDELTGRVADKRRWPDGLQAALEAKENITVQSRGNILNSITLQHFIGKYGKISGMTATARSAEEEFKAFYGLDIVVIPPNKACIREDNENRVFGTREQKESAIIQEIIQVHEKGRPVLVGTGSVEESERLSNALFGHNINCAVLNAKNDEYEAGIIALAGKLNAVTISTNMAGRGTDIRLGGDEEEEKKQIIALGGLYVIGTNKHESKRIDNQLRGRAGRQGDPGSSCFFISMEDPLFVKYRLADLLPIKVFRERPSGEIENRLIKREMDRIQRIVEGQNLEIKKTLNKYYHVIEKQREFMFRNRRDILFEDTIQALYRVQTPDQVKRLLARVGREKTTELCRKISLYYMDDTWSQYLDMISSIREGIHLTRIGQQNPLIVFNKLAVQTFDRLWEDMEWHMVERLNRIDPNDGDLDPEGMGLKAPSSTWTYLINDNPFEDMPWINIAANFGLSMGMSIPLVFAFIWPFMLLAPLLKRFRRKKS